MRKFICLVTLKFIFFHVSATNYYLSNSGNDLNSGTSPTTAWQTIEKLNSVALVPGDSIFFEAGGIFRGEIVVNSGGTVSSPIYFGMYGTGDSPVISGSQVISGWILYTGNIYRVSFDSAVAHVFSNGSQMTIARFPNSELLTYQHGIADSGFVDTTLTQPTGYWDGATVRFRASDRRWMANTVKSFSDDSIIFVNPAGADIGVNRGYYFDNLLSVLDTAGEWFYDTATEDLYFWAPGSVDPSTLQVEASVSDYGFLVQNGSSHLIIENLLFEKQRKDGIYTNQFSSNLIVRNCDFEVQAETGINLSPGTENTIINSCLFERINGIAIRLYNSFKSEVTGNTFRQIGTVAGYGAPELSNNLMAIDCISSDSILITRNDMDSIGSSGIFIGMKNSTVSRNTINHCLLLTNDLAAIYCYGFSAQNCQIEENFILNTIGNVEGITSNPVNAAGIYLDEVSNGNTIVQNTITYGSSGILIAKGSTENALNENVVYGATEAQLKITEGGTQGSTSENEVNGNTFYALHELADVVFFRSSFTNFLPASFDSNYYFNPYSLISFRKIEPPGNEEFPLYYTLDQWQQETGFDMESSTGFILRDRHVIEDTLSDDLISNGDFTNNFDSWINEKPDSMDMALDNSTPLDFGCLKLSFLVDDSSAHAFVYTDGIVMDSASQYLLYISNYSTRDGNIVLKSIQDYGGYGPVAAPRPFPFTSLRRDYHAVSEVFRDCYDCRHIIELSGKDSLVWIDNVALWQVSTSYEIPEKRSRLFTNNTEAIADFNLQDSVFYNLDQEMVTGILSVAPYSSVILIFDSSLISSNPITTEEPGFLIFPNPVDPGNSVYIDIKGNDVEEISILDRSGKTIFESHPASVNDHYQLQIPPGLSSGLYFISIRTNGVQRISKLIVM